MQSKVNIGRMAALVGVALSLSGCVTAYDVTPVDFGSAKVTYNSGKPTVDQEQEHGAMKVTPLGVEENGRLSFAVAAVNKSDKPANFGAENFTSSVGGAPAQVFTYAQLVKEAKTQAAVNAFAVALAGASAAYSANQNAYTRYNSTTYTPSGRMYQTTATVYNPTAGAINNAAATAATAGGMIAIRRQLDATIDSLGHSMLQTTTVDPGNAFGGMIVVAKPKQAVPYTVEVHGRWNDEDYVFRFNVATVK